MAEKDKLRACTFLVSSLSSGEEKQEGTFYHVHLNVFLQYCHNNAYSLLRLHSISHSFASFKIQSIFTSTHLFLTIIPMYLPGHHVRSKMLFFVFWHSCLRFFHVPLSRSMHDHRFDPRPALYIRSNL